MVSDSARRRKEPIGRGTDAAVFDPVHHLVFSSNGTGSLSVFREDQLGRLTALGDVRTVPGARTMATDPQTGRVFQVAADLDATAPVIPGLHRVRPHCKAGTVKLLVLIPGQGG